MMTFEVKDSSTLFFDTSEGVNNMKPFPDEWGGLKLPSGIESLEMLTVLSV